MQAFGSGSARREAVPRAGRACYSGASGKRLPRAAGRALVAACLIVAAPGLGGCAYRLDSLFRASSDDGRETTGSIPQVVKATPVAEPSGDPEADSDLAYAGAAAATQMGDSAKGGAQPWENPRTGARGMVTALAAPYDDHCPINRPPRDGHMAFVRSPDGISVEVLQDGHLPPQEPWASTPNTGGW